MATTRILIFVESRYKVNRKGIKKVILDTLSENAVTTPVEVSVAVVGDRKMRLLNQKYRNLDKTTNVLSFPLSEGEQTPLPADFSADIIRLGDIVLSYPVVIQEAARDEVMVDEKINELVAHGLLHLLGLHHE